MNTSALEELHRHREFHIGQLNAVNFAGSIALIGIVFALFLGDLPSSKPGGGAMGWIMISLIAPAAVLVWFGVTLHWRWHARQIRRVDELIGHCLRQGSSFQLNEHPGDGLGGSTPYVLTGVGVTVAGIAGLAYICGGLV